MPSTTRASFTFSSAKDFQRMQHLANLMDCSESSLCDLAISQWLRDNYRTFLDLYSTDS